MITYTEVDGEHFRGTLLQQMDVHPWLGVAFHSYLSADLGNNDWSHVEKWTLPGETPPSDTELRKRLAVEIRRRLKKRAA